MGPSAVSTRNVGARGGVSLVVKDALFAGFEVAREGVLGGVTGHTGGLAVGMDFAKLPAPIALDDVNAFGSLRGKNPFPKQINGVS